MFREFNISGVVAVAILFGGRCFVNFNHWVMHSVADYGIFLCTYRSNGSVDIYGNCLRICCITNHVKMATNRGRNV
jgi:hypothetical protein